MIGCSMLLGVSIGLVLMRFRLKKVTTDSFRILYFEKGEHSRSDSAQFGVVSPPILKMLTVELLSNDIL